MKVDDFIEVLKSAQEGKTIIRENWAKDGWETYNLLAAIDRVEFKVQTEPREWIVRVGGTALYYRPEDVNAASGLEEKYIKVREVME